MTTSPTTPASTAGAGAQSVAGATPVATGSPGLVGRVPVARATRASRVGLTVAVPLVLALAALPYLAPRGTQLTLVTLFSLVILATTWNLLAGYSGMVSIGQQAYIGVGAYGLVYLADTVGLDPFLAIPVAVAIAGLISIPVSYLAFRLIGGYFAIGTWVVAEVFKLVTTQVSAVGGGSGTSLTAYSGYSPVVRIAYVYWLALVAMVLTVVVTYLALRSRLGLGFTAIRDDSVAAASLGVAVTRSKRIVFVLAAMGAALAGAVIASSTLRVQPESVYSVQYSAFMLFMVVIGGIGTIEGPILGAVVFFLLQQWLSDLGSWYLVVLGALAIVVVLFAPAGLWGLVTRGRVRLFPVGYRLVDARSLVSSLATTTSQRS